MSKVIQTLPFNRVEGDLEVRVAMDGGVVEDAWSVGTMYRGFENIMTGRGPLDGLVLTPRVCGICSTSHLTAAAKALDDLFEARVPDNGIRIRNIALGTEHVQSDIRQAILLFMCDFANPAYAKHPLYEEALRRYEPLKGQSAARAVTETARLIEIISILGGQWPHSSFMLPGGVVSTPGNSEFVQCRVLLEQFQKWYEANVLGCSLERWRAVNTLADLAQWLDEAKPHQEGDLGFFIRFAKSAGLDALGKGCEHFLSFGCLDLPADTGVTGCRDAAMLLAAGYGNVSASHPVDQKNITEDVAFSWFGGGSSPLHPAAGTTVPYATGNESDKYSWAKAPRYAGVPAETGPQAELILSGHPLITDLVRQNKPSAFTRELARIIRPAILLPALIAWADELTRIKEPMYLPCAAKAEGEGIGLVQAPRGALGHWVRIEKNKIKSYQIITPTTWNASPRDQNGLRGPLEQALIGTPVKDIRNPIELGHIVRSFDPCLVCTVHAVTLEGAAVSRLFVRQ